MVSIPGFLKGADNKVKEIFSQYLEDVTTKAEKLFAVLFVFQWLMGIVFALFVSPRTWSGEQSQIHIHVYAAIFLGGAIAAFPLYLIYSKPGSPFTRHVVAASQMLFSALLIHLSGGRIETHFHVFGGLAFIAFFRDWKTIVTATVVVALDHLIRGIFWPQSVYGVLAASPWRSLEHAAWVIFEDVVLFYSVQMALREAARVAEKENLLTTERNKVVELNQTLEEKVKARTQELREVQRIAVQNAHEAGMSEIATGVLHNIGNVLNSANVGLETILQKYDRSVSDKVIQANSLLSQNKNRLGDFFANDPKGEKLANFYLELGEALKDEVHAQKTEAKELMKKLQLIKDIINTQQTYAKGNGEFKESMPLPEIVENALMMQTNSLVRHEIKIVKKYGFVPPVLVQKTKLVHVVLNLIKNAKEAMDNGDQREKVLTLEIEKSVDGGAYLKVMDTGTGIDKTSLTKVFNHGYTTKKTGHGFGLHFCANAVAEMGGKIIADSGGPGHGACFTITFGKDCVAENAA